MSITHIAGALIATALAVPTLALSAPVAHASHGGATKVKVAGTCTGSATSKLKAKADDGRLEVEFEVDARRRAQVWAVRLTDNGVTVWSGHRTTKGRSASFSVEKKIANRAGADVLTALATNTVTGQVCTATLTYAG
ncbi:MAG: hypothetical protein LCH96_18225 [Actinobacteria bacterium]|nr:hypothetical protein [Actinomycetota bacterium]